MRRPPYGLSLPCRLVRVLDGDTVEVSLRNSDRKWKLRLLDCWAPEKNTPEGKEAKAYAESLLEGRDDLAVFIPVPEDPLKLLSAATFDRVLSYLFLDSRTTLNESMVQAGHATKTKEPKHDPR